MYEPYFVVDKRSVPLYDLRFTGGPAVRPLPSPPFPPSGPAGYGNDKSSHAYELHAAGFSFLVHPTAFATHMQHAPTTWADAADLGASWRRWWRFKEDVRTAYGFSMPLPRA